MGKKTHPDTREHDKVRPDDGQGSEGHFGSDGDWGKQPEKTEKKTEPDSSPVPPKKAK